MVCEFEFWFGLTVMGCGLEPKLATAGKLKGPGVFRGNKTILKGESFKKKKRGDLTIGKSSDVREQDLTGGLLVCEV